eukprot:COSAG06_NODE_67250_length_252_cov_0.921569_1_plen_50_part_10
MQESLPPAAYDAGVAGTNWKIIASGERKEAREKHTFAEARHVLSDLIEAL